MSTLTAEIITSGTEILLGDIVDTNAAWIAQQLRECGVNLYYKTTVGDNEPRLRGVIELCMARSDVILITGGLGPTVDDITRDAIANATRCPLLLHDGALATLEGRFARFGVTMTDNNRRQALIPQGAILVENPAGTAPGFIVEGDRSTVIALPGVPREMKEMMAATVLPYLRARLGSAAVIRRRILRTFGIGESSIDAQLDEQMRRSNPTVGLAAHTGQVDIRIAARAEEPASAERMLDEMEAEVRALVGAFVYTTTPDESFEAVLVPRLAAAGVSLALFETNTGGMLAERLSAAGGAALIQGQYRAGVGELPPLLAAAETALESSQRQSAALQAAAWLRAQSGATIGLALVGTAGAEEGVYGRVAGESWLAIDSAAEQKSVRTPYGGQDEITQVRLCNQALAQLQQWLASYGAGR